MSKEFIFETDQTSYDFCVLIAEEMVKNFDISLEEAIKRINFRWKKRGKIVGNSIVYHETVEYWAYDIYYGHDSGWWHRLGDPTLRPVLIN